MSALVFWGLLAGVIGFCAGLAAAWLGFSLPIAALVGLGALVIVFLMGALCMASGHVEDER